MAIMIVMIITHLCQRNAHSNCRAVRFRLKNLTIGALVDTLNGPLPVEWIGRQKFKRIPRLTGIESVAPIWVTRFAFHDLYPNRDLYLSPTHSLLVDRVLIPVEHLVNGRSVVGRRWTIAKSSNTSISNWKPTNNVCRGGPAETFLVSDRPRGVRKFRRI